MTTDFGRRVKKARNHAQLTQKELAPLVGMSQSNLSELETVAHESGKTVHLAVACGVNPIWLAMGDGEMLDPLIVKQQSPLPHAKSPPLAAALSAVAQILSGLNGTHLGMAKAGLHELIERPDELGSAVSALEALLASDTQIRKRA